MSSAEKTSRITPRFPGLLEKENGKIFGGITSKEISENLKAQYGFEVDKKKIELKETIKALGEYNVSIKLFEGVVADLKIQVISG